MPSSYVDNHFHVVFSTKNRECAIAETLQPKLWAYMAGIVKNHGMKALAIGGTNDHIHALLSLPGPMSIAKAVQVVKANSSRWMNESRASRFEMAGRIFLLHREPITDLKSDGVHRKPKRTPPKT